MKCDVCQKEYENIVITITDKNGEYHYCPNCLAINFCQDNLVWENNDSFVDEITKLNGAIKFSSYGEEYYLERETMLRLVSHNLMPNEYFELIKIHGNIAFELHEDFYTKDGIAWQPLEK